MDSKEWGLSYKDTKTGPPHFWKLPCKKFWTTAHISIGITVIDREAGLDSLSSVDFRNSVAKADAMSAGRLMGFYRHPRMYLYSGPCGLH